MKSNPNALSTVGSNTIFTNVALKPNGDVYWEGLEDNVPEAVTSWLRTERYPDSGYDAAHPNSRFTVPAVQCPVIDPQWDSAEGVPIDAIIFGGRRSTTVPLVYEALDWQHGVFIGASMTSETTAAAAGKRGVLRADPFAMRPFCGYNMGDYFAHWLSFQERTDRSKLPKIFHVNWFRKNKQGKFLWPGFGENIRVLEWILNRTNLKQGDLSLAQESPIGIIPATGAINIAGLEGVNTQSMNELNDIDPSEWLPECKKTKEFFANFQDRTPQTINTQLELLEQRLEKSKK